MSRKTSLFRAAVCTGALLALVAAFGYVDTSATPPSSTAQEGQSYLLWARDSTARIWVLDAAGGLVREHVLPWDTRPAPGQVWFPRELMMGPDGSRRLLWTEPTTGRSVAWTLDDSFQKTGELAFQASNPAADWYTTDLEKDANGTGRLLWFNGFVGSAVLWGLDANNTKVSTKIFTPAADVGAWVPIDYSRAPDGSARLVWTYVWNGIGPWGGKSAVWFLDGNDQKLGSQVITYAADWYLRTYHFGNDGRLRFLLANDNQATGKICTSLTDTTAVPTVEGWGVGKCKTFGPERGWILRSYTGNVPLDLSAHERAMIERESQRLGIPPERFISPTEISFGDFTVSTDQLSVAGGGGNLGQLIDKDVTLWPDGKMYLHFVDQSPSFVQTVLDQCQKWASVAGVSCRSGGITPRLTVYRTSDASCSTHGLGSGPNVSIHINGNPECANHELGHALGLIHTHQREDRDASVKIHHLNVSAAGYPQIVDRFRLNYAQGPYDYYSTMHYPHDAFHNAAGPSTITRLDGSTNLGGSNTPTEADANLMRSLYPGTGIVSPATEFIQPPLGNLDFFISHVNVAGQPYSPGSIPVVNPGDAFNMTIRVTNSGRDWLASEGLSMEVRRSGDFLNLTGGSDPSTVTVPINHSVATNGQFAIQFGAEVSPAAPPLNVRLLVSLLASNGVPLANDSIFLAVSHQPNATGSARMVSVVPQVGVVPVGGLLPFEVKVENPGTQPETVRVRGYIGGATVTDPQPSFQLRTIDPEQTATFVYSVVAPPTPGPIKAYGQIYTVTGIEPYDGAESPDVPVTNPPSCGGCDFTGVPCGQEGRCVNNPAQGCGVAHACGTYCEENAEVQQVTTTPNPVPPHTAFTVTARVKNLSTEVNTVSVRGFTDLPGVAPADSWHHDQAMQPFETRNFHFSFTAPASGSFQSHAQVWCPGAPLPFVGNASSPVTIGGGGGSYSGIPPSASIVYVGPEPVTAGGSVALAARVHNHNNYTTPFYLRPYSDAPTVQELPRLAVSIPPQTDITELFVFDVPNAPGQPLDLHFQVEYTIGGPALSGASATGIPIAGPGPSPSPTPSPEDICPGPDDGDATGCPLDGQGNQTYRTCQSCRSAHTWASSCKQKQNLEWCWKPL